MPAEPPPEPWLRGPIPGAHPLIAPVLFSFQQAQEDLARFTEALTPAQLWMRPHGFGSAGFHIRHIGVSVDRLTTYLQGRELTPAQLSAPDQAAESGMTRDELLAELEAAFRHAAEVFGALDPATLPDPRTVGRQHLPTTGYGLLVHIAEHTQRHVGQAIAAAKLAAFTG